MNIGAFGRAKGRGEIPEASSGAGKGPTAHEGRCTALIDQGSQFDGKVRVEGTIRVDGELKGEITSANSVVVGEVAAIEANIRAKSVIINGSVVGNVVASRQVVLRPPGRLHGNVETPSLIIESGAIFNGSSKMFRPETVAHAKTEKVQAKDTTPERPRTYARGDRASGSGLQPGGGYLGAMRRE